MSMAFFISVSVIANFVSERSVEHLPGSKDVRLDSPNREVETLGDFLVTLFLNMAESNHPLVFFWQLCDGFIQKF